MPFAKIEARRSRPPEQIQALIEAVYLGIAPADIFIVLAEPPLDNWGIRGGTPASEVDLGFTLKV